jgi:hypothetical protein
LFIASRKALLRKKFKSNYVNSQMIAVTFFAPHQSRAKYSATHSIRARIHRQKELATTPDKKINYCLYSIFKQQPKLNRAPQWATNAQPPSIPMP